MACPGFPSCREGRWLVEGEGNGSRHRFPLLDLKDELLLANLLLEAEALEQVHLVRSEV